MRGAWCVMRILEAHIIQEQYFQHFHFQLGRRGKMHTVPGHFHPHGEEEILG